MKHKWLFWLVILLMVVPALTATANTLATAQPRWAAWLRNVRTTDSNCSIYHYDACMTEISYAMILYNMDRVPAHYKLIVELKILMVKTDNFLPQPNGGPVWIRHEFFDLAESRIEFVGVDGRQHLKFPQEWLARGAVHSDYIDRPIVYWYPWLEVWLVNKNNPDDRKPVPLKKSETEFYAGNQRETYHSDFQNPEYTQQAGNNVFSQKHGVPRAAFNHLTGQNVLVYNRALNEAHNQVCNTRVVVFEDAGFEGEWGFYNIQACPVYLDGTNFDDISSAVIEPPHPGLRLHLAEHHPFDADNDFHHSKNLVLDEQNPAVTNLDDFELNDQVSTLWWEWDFVDGQGTAHAIPCPCSDHYATFGGETVGPVTGSQ